MKISKIGFFMLLMLALGTTGLFGAEEFTQLTKAGTGAKESTQSAIGAWIWVSALFPLALALLLLFVTKNYLEKQEEQGQYKPKVAKYASMIGAFIGGFLIMYIVYGVAGAVLFDKSFGEMWASLVMDFYKGLL